MDELLKKAIEYLLRIAVALEPALDWQKHKCGDGTCGHWAPKGQDTKPHCRLCPDARSGDPACPRYVARKKS